MKSKLPDSDRDGIPDSRDRCPQRAEDRDGFQDQDGCPDNDNDGDGISDAVDKCRNEPETFNRYQDGDGCPDQNIHYRAPSRPLIRDTVYFKAGSRVLGNSARLVLGTVCAFLKRNLRVKLVQIQGHSQDPGGRAANRRIAKARAAVVQAYLVRCGVAATRLKVASFGRSRPRRRGSSATVRAVNRRVEFRIVTWTPPPPPGPPRRP